MGATVTVGLALTVAGAGLASATTSAATATVNIRSGPGTSHTILGQLVRGQRITTTGAPKSGWVAASFAGRRAYISARYVDSVGALPSLPTRISTSGTKVATATLNVRSGASRSYRIVGHLSEGSRITLTGRLSHGYAQTRYAGHLRWVSVGYLASARSTSGSAPRSAPAPAPAPSATKGQRALAFAKRQLGKPYVFGAAGPGSYDCSGLTLASWRSAGVSIPRTSQQQYARGHRIAKSQLRAGDLVFFYSQSPSHVAIYAGNGMVIHSPRPGRSVAYIKMSYMPYAGAVRPS